MTILIAKEAMRIVYGGQRVLTTNLENVTVVSSIRDILNILRIYQLIKPPNNRKKLKCNKDESIE